jgi:hypothetical protein
MNQEPFPIKRQLDWLAEGTLINPMIFALWKLS